MTIIDVHDDFSLEKIKESGQCFRLTKDKTGDYRLIAHGKVLHLKDVPFDPSVPADLDEIPGTTGSGSKPDGNASCTGTVNGSPAGPVRLEVDCDVDEWNNVWHEYFDMDRNYRDLRGRLMGIDPHLDEALEWNAGIRILRQSPWEMLVTFIISQRRSIPSITTSVSRLCSKYGDPVFNNQGGVEGHAFPTPINLVDASLDGIRSCGVGYRDAYIKDAAVKVNDGRLDLIALESLDDEALVNSLEEVKGVGLKVASCIALFGYGRLDVVPVDVWIKRLAESLLEDGMDVFDECHPYAGLAQQYLYGWGRANWGKISR